VDGNTQYRAVLKFINDGRVQLILTRMIGGTDTTMNAVTLPGTYTTGTVLRVRFDVDGVSPTTLRAKAWPVTGAEPAGWQANATDSSAQLQAAGAIGVMQFVSGLATTVPVRLQVDDWWAGPAGTIPGTPANLAPTAGFTHAESGLTAAFTNTSTDPENGALSYSWNFGDGSPADTTASPTHPYAAAGTYTVVLTATDPGGLTDTETQTVTVAGTTLPWPGAGAVAADRFERSVANGWGTAEVGGAWTAPSTASVSSGSGRLQVTTGGATATALQNGVSIRDVSLRADIALEALPTGNGASMTLMTRRVGNDHYRAVVKFLPDGRLTLTFTRVAGGVETSLRGVGFPGVTYGAGDVVHVRFDVTGEGPVTLQSKLWLGAAPEPVTWQNTFTDSTAPLTAAGGVGTMLFSYNNNTTLPLRAVVDNWWAGPSGTEPPAP
jgi:PKD repeat protein